MRSPAAAGPGGPEPVAVRQDLIAAVRSALAGQGDPERAVRQQAYMRSRLPYFGVTLPVLRRTVRPLLADSHLRPRSREEWEATVRALFVEAGHREERYAATLLARHRLARDWQDAETLSLYRELVVTGAWWDSVDEIAGNLVGPILLRHKRDVAPTMRGWAVDGDVWLRRAAILSQLTAKEATDTALLAHTVESNLEGTAYGRVFWIRKAIGWALRQYARTDPDWVGAFVVGHADRMSGLSRREALKHCPAPQERAAE